MLTTPVSIAVGTKYRDFFEQCRESVDRLNVPSRFRKFFVQDEGDPWDIPGWIRLASPVPFPGHPTIVNMAVAACSPDDLVWIHDDAAIIDPNLIDSLQSTAYSFPKAGPVSPLIDGGVGNPLQKFEGSRVTKTVTSPDGLAFICIYFRRDLLDAVGPLDERYTGYGPDDHDYSNAAISLGYPCLIDCSVVVRHGIGDYDFASTWQRNSPDHWHDANSAMRSLYYSRWPLQ